MTYIILDRGIWLSEDDEDWNIHITNWRKKISLGEGIDNFREFE